MALATFVADASAYGYKYNRDPYTGECSLQVNLPGGAKKAYPAAPSSTLSLFVQLAVLNSFESDDIFS